MRRWGLGTLQSGPQTGYLLAAGQALMGISSARNIFIMPPPQGPGPDGGGARGRAGALRRARGRARGARRAVGAGRRLGLLPGAGRARAGLPAGAHRRARARVRPRAHAAGATGGSSARAAPAEGQPACFSARRTPGAPCCGRWRAACWAWEAVSVARAARPLPSAPRAVADCLHCINTTGLGEGLQGAPPRRRWSTQWLRSWRALTPARRLARRRARARASGALRVVRTAAASAAGVTARSAPRAGCDGPRGEPRPAAPAPAPRGLGRLGHLLTCDWCRLGTQVLVKPTHLCV